MIDYTTYKAEDLLLDEHFIRYCRNDDAGAVRFWTDLLASQPLLQAEANRAKELYRIMSVSAPDVQKEQALLVFKEELQKLETPVRKLPWIRYAAAAAVVLALAASFFFLQTGKPSSGMKQVTDYSVARFGQLIKADDNKRKQVELPDGSVVLLNYGSSIRLDSSYNESQRWLYLDGEAFFSVHHDTARPFVVITNQAATTALGTSFKVRSYPGEEVSTIMLATGKVRVQSLMHHKVQADINLTPGEEASCGQGNGPVRSGFDQLMLEDWRLGKVIFDKSGLEEIIRILEFNYGVRVKLQHTSSKPIAFTGKFLNKSLDEVLEAIAFSNKFSYSKNNGIVSIQFR